MAGVLTVLAALAALAAVILTSRSLKNADHSTPAWEPRAKSLMRSDFEVALSVSRICQVCVGVPLLQNRW